MSLCLFAVVAAAYLGGDPMLGQEPSATSNDAGLSAKVRDSIGVVAAGRKHRIAAAIEEIRRNPAPQQLRSVEDIQKSMLLEAAINRLGKEHAVEAIPVLLENLSYDPLGVPLRGVDHLNGLPGFPAAAALVKIGPPALPALLEMAKTVDPARYDIRNNRGNFAKWEIHTLLLKTMYGAAGDMAIVDAEIKAELTRLLGEKRPNAETQKQIMNLQRMVDEANRLRDHPETPNPFIGTVEKHQRRSRKHASDND